MNRRELFERIATVTAAAGVTEATVSLADPQPVPALAVIEFQGIVPRDSADRIRTIFEEGLKGTPFEGVRCLVLSDGAKLTFLDGHGRPITRDLGPTGGA